MSDTHYGLKLNCAYCGKENYPDNSGYGFPDGLIYHDTKRDFICEFCGKKNKIIVEFRAIRIIKKRI